MIFFLNILRDSKLRAAKDHGKKFQSSSFGGIINWASALFGTNILKFLKNMIMNFLVREFLYVKRCKGTSKNSGLWQPFINIFLGRVTHKCVW